jgi:hypothetical protein
MTKSVPSRSKKRSKMLKIGSSRLSIKFNLKWKLRRDRNNK